MHHPTDRITHTTAFVTPVVEDWLEREVAQWVHSWCDGSSDRSFTVEPLTYFSFQPVLHDCGNKGHGMYYPVCRMKHIKEPLLLFGKKIYLFF